MRLLTYILYVVLIVGAASIYLTATWGQENETKAPPAVVTTPVPQIKVSPPTNVATLPNPNFQYLPQKAFVQTFTPEVQPTTPTAVIGPIPITQGGQPVVTTTQPVVSAAPAIDYMSIISTIIAAGSGFMAKMGYDKSKKVEATSQANAGAIVDSKVVQQELARLLFEWNKDKADSLNGSAPAVKLESLKDEVKEATETASKA